MIRRLNYTGRVRIARQDVRIVLREDDGKLSFDATLSIGDYGLPVGALVVVEAYRQTMWMRFPFGTVGATTPPADRTLSEFDTPDDILFRVKVTQADDRHILLAEADRIPLRRPEDEDQNRIPLLPVKPEDLGDEIWRLDFSDDRPRLLINKLAGDHRLVGRSPAFFSLVYPAALCQVLTRILVTEKHDDSDDADDWRSLWLRFALQLPGVGPIPDIESAQECEDWIDGVTESFATRNQTLTKFAEFWKGEDAQ